MRRQAVQFGQRPFERGDEAIPVGHLVAVNIMDELVSNRRDEPEPLLQSLRQSVLNAGDSFMKTLAYSPVDVRTSS